MARRPTTTAAEKAEAPPVLRDLIPTEAFRLDVTLADGSPGTMNTTLEGLAGSLAPFLPQGGTTPAPGGGTAPGPSLEAIVAEVLKRLPKPEPAPVDMAAVIKAVLAQVEVIPKRKPRVRETTTTGIVERDMVGVLVKKAASKN